MKHSVTGKESGASEAPFITPVSGEFLIPFGKTPNDILRRHRAAQDGVSDDPPTQYMKRGNFFEDGARHWFMEEFECHIAQPQEGFRNEHCNMVSSLDGVFTEDWKPENLPTIPMHSVWECKIPARPATPTDSMVRVLQVQAQMDCSNAEFAVIAELAQMDCVWRWTVVPRHDPTIRAIRDAVNVFWDHMKNDTDYPPITSQEASKMIGGNRRPEPHDLIEGPTEDIMNDARTDLMDSAENYLNAQRTKKAADLMMERESLTMKSIMGGLEKVQLPDGILLSHSTVEYKAQPEKTKVTPAKPASTSRRFSIKQKEADK